MKLNFQPEKLQQGVIKPGLVGVVLVIALTALVVTWLTSGMLGANKWPIKWLDVSGPLQRVSADQIRAVLEPEINGGFFTIDLDRVRAITEGIPWVSSAEARTQFPDTIEVRVLEYTAVAHWGSSQLISEQGVAFTVPAANKIQGLPRLQGPDNQLEAVVTFWQQANKRLGEVSLEVEDLRLHKRGSWELLLMNNTRVMLGRENVLPRLQRLIANWNQLTQRGVNIPLSVDLRYTNGFAVQWVESS
ncbi:MAG: cell division protein FtsQ/DivIB [Xanthomonadales bacterium]|nr:cell division protein FtsQ/DivIB [Xanthomonadales bacterium]